MEAIRTLCNPHPWEEDPAVFASALGQLAEVAAMADLEDACKLSKAAREAGALQLCCDAVRHESARVHQPALAVLVCFTTTEVDPDAHLNRAIVSAHPRGFEGVVERLFSDVPLTVALACGALQNLCRADVAHVAMLSACGGTERLRSLTMCGQDGIAVAANACLTNLLGWHRAASRVQLRSLIATDDLPLHASAHRSAPAWQVQLRYLRHQRRVMGMQLRRMSHLKTSPSLPNLGRAAPALITLDGQHSRATATPHASADHGTGPPSMQVPTTAATASPGPPSVCIALVLFNLVVASADQADYQADCQADGARGGARGGNGARSQSITDPNLGDLADPNLGDLADPNLGDLTDPNLGDIADFRAVPPLPPPAPPPPPPPPGLLAEQSTIAAAAAEAQAARAAAAMQKVVVARAAAAAAAAEAAAAAASTEPHATPKKGLSLFKSAGRAALTANAMRLEQIQRGDCMLIASLLTVDAMQLEQIQRGDCMLIASLLACMHRCRGAAACVRVGVRNVPSSGGVGAGGGGGGCAP
jgi:hypothetical protein